jgi:hypothetical protein
MHPFAPSLAGRRAGLVLLCLLALLLGPLAGCKQSTSSTVTPLSAVTTTCFQGGTATEVDLTQPMATWTWNDPHVLKVGSQYWMYASATEYFKFPVKLYRLTSSDGTSWSLDSATPILDVGGVGEWDSDGVETPAVVRFGGKYHLFYTGYNNRLDPFTYQVGHATSTDGVNFTRDPGNPIVVPSGAADFRQYLVAEPGPVVFRRKIYLYFTAVGVDPVLGGLQTIGVTTSANGSAWSTPTLALSPDQNQYPVGSGWAGYSTPNAIALPDGVNLFVDVASNASGSWTQVALHHALSADGVTAWVQDSAPIRSYTDFAWTAHEIRSPDALLDGSLLRLYFAGDDYDAAVPSLNNFGIGQMTCDLAP